VIGISPVSEHGDRLRERGRVLTGPTETLQDRARNPIWAGIPDLLGPDRIRVGTLSEVSEQLGEQERVATRGAMAGFHEVLVGAAAEGVTQQLLDGALTEWTRPDHLEVGVLADLDSNRVRTRLSGTGGKHEKESYSVEARREEGEKSQRRPICPMEVIDDQQHGAALGEVGGEPVETVEVPVFGVGRGSRRPGRRKNGHPQFGCPADDLRPCLIVESGEHRLEQLANWTEGEFTLELGGAGASDLKSFKQRPLTDRLKQPSLADAGRSLDQDRSPRPASGLEQCFCHRLELRISLQ
jgi:hypothetical protein